MIQFTQSTKLTVEDALELLRWNREEVEKDSEAALIHAIEYEYEGRTITLDVLGYDIDAPGTVTVQMHYTTDEDYQFTNEASWKSGKKNNIWRTSSIRKELNSEGFINRYFAGLDDVLVEVEKTNEGDEVTCDKVFLLSVKEMKDSLYPFFQTQKAWAKTDTKGMAQYCWARSAILGYANYVWIVYSSGYVNYNYANYGYRCAPACVIGLNQ